MNRGSEDEETVLTKNTPRLSWLSMTDNTEVILEGSITRIVFKSPDSTFIVARLKLDDNVLLSTIVGEMPNCHEGERVRIKGIREMHPTHGERIRVNYYESIAPSTNKDLIAFLSSGLIKGIGEEYAKRIVDEFGEDTLNIIDKHPELIIKGCRYWQEEDRAHQVILCKAEGCCKCNDLPFKP